MLIDFHCHTNCSDGELSPVEIVGLAENRGIKIFAITDHDNIDAYSQLTDIKTEMNIISGIEFSTTWNKIGVHIVALNFNLQSQNILEVINKQKEFRNIRAKTISKKMEKCGLQNAYEKILSNGANQIGRPDFANLLVREGICKDFRQAFKKYLGTGKIGDVKNQWLSIDTIIQNINTANGIAVLAHPLAYKLTNSKLKRLIKDFKSLGGHGMEVINGYQNQDKTKYLVNLCKEYKLKASMGSDYHYSNNWRQLGCNTNLISGVGGVWDNLQIKTESF